MSTPLVMFIDDSETALASTRMVTDSMPIQVKQYLKAPDALSDINNGMIPHLIVTDMNMPAMNGMEFLSELRKIQSTSRTPVLMLTTETKDELKAQGKALGLTGWVVKPFKPSQLQGAISKILRLP